MTTNIQLARQVASRVQLESITLKRAVIDSDIDVEALPESLVLEQQHRSAFSRQKKGDSHFVTVLVEFQFFARESNADSASDLVKLDAEFKLSYSIDGAEEIEDRCFHHFAELNGPYNAWPYWRELVQSATGRVGLSGITVPVFRPISKRVDSPENEGEQEGR